VDALRAAQPRRCICWGLAARHRAGEEARGIPQGFCCTPAVHLHANDVKARTSLRYGARPPFCRRDSRDYRLDEPSSASGHQAAWRLLRERRAGAVAAEMSSPSRSFECRCIRGVQREALGMPRASSPARCLAARSHRCIASACARRAHSSGLASECACHEFRGSSRSRRATARRTTAITSSSEGGAKLNKAHAAALPARTRRRE